MTPLSLQIKLLGKIRHSLSADFLELLGCRLVSVSFWEWDGLEKRQSLEGKMK